MATPVQHQAATTYGAQGTPIVKVMPPPVVPNPARSPATTDLNYLIGQTWVNNSNDTAWMLSSKTTSAATWIALGSGATGGVVTLTGDSGGAISPTAGNINTLGTASQITVTGAGSTLTWSIPAAFIAPGSIDSTTTIASGTTLTAGTSLSVTTSAVIGTTLTATGGTTTLGALTQTGTANINATGAGVTTIGTGGTGAVNIGNSTGNTAVTGSLTASTTLTATLGAITATNGNLVLGTAGNKIVSSSVASTTTAGANSFGTVTLVNGTATISTTAVTASSIIMLTRMSPGATGAAALGILSVGTITASTSFVINALTTADSTAVATTDVSSIGWMIIN